MRRDKKLYLYDSPTGGSSLTGGRGYTVYPDAVGDLKHDSYYAPVKAKVVYFGEGTGSWMSKDAEALYDKDLRQADNSNGWQAVHTMITYLPLVGTADKVLDIRDAHMRGQEVSGWEYAGLAVSFAGDVMVVAPMLGKGADLGVKVLRGKGILRAPGSFSKSMSASRGLASLHGIEADAAGEFLGTPEDLIAALRKASSSLSSEEAAQLEAVVKRMEILKENIKILSDADFEANLARWGNSRKTTAIYKDGTVFLRQSRGEDILLDFVHEGTHALDLSRNGLFRGIDSFHLTPEQLFTLERRAYMNEKLISGKIPFRVYASRAA